MPDDERRLVPAQPHMLVIADDLVEKAMGPESVISADDMVCIVLVFDKLMEDLGVW
jgi:hypothetical protein